MMFTLIPAPLAGATGLQTTVLSPVDGAISSNPAEPHHRPYTGDYSFDVHTSRQKRPVYARFRNTNGSLSLTVNSVGRACASGRFADGGDKLVLNVLINGSKVGTVTYAHLSAIRYNSGSVPVGAQIGDVATSADGLAASSCWTGPHVHVEPRNDVRYGCYFSRPLGSGADGSSPLGIVGGERAAGVNQLCPAGAETPGGGEPVDPFGSYDSLSSPAPGQIKVRGWAVDPDTKTTPIAVHVYIGGPAGTPGAEGLAITANVSRPDVANVHPAYGAVHGFDHVLTTGKVGAQQVCVYAINNGPGSNQSLGCKTTTIENPNPFGNYDSVSSPSAGQIKVGGWAVDPNTKTSPVAVHVYVGGPAGTPGAESMSITANVTRPDVANAHPAYGAVHGFNHVLNTGKVGTQQVCVYAINTGPGSNQSLGCKTTTIESPLPFGAYEGLSSPSAGQVKVFGWAADPNTKTAPIAVNAYIGGSRTTPGAEKHVLAANGSRSDVARNYPNYGAAHGFNSTLNTAKTGQQNVCLYAVNVGPGTDTLLGCRTTMIENPTPFGSFDSLSSPAPGQIRVTGWAADPNTKFSPIAVNIYVGGYPSTPGVEKYILTANTSRPDVAGRYPAYGAAHGFAATLNTKKTGKQKVCAYAMNKGPGADRLLGCADTNISPVVK